MENLDTAQYYGTSYMLTTPSMSTASIPQYEILYFAEDASNTTTTCFRPIEPTAIIEAAKLFGKEIQHSPDYVVRTLLE